MIAAKVLQSPESLKISSTPIETMEIILFQRMSVVVSDFVYFYAVYEWIWFLSRDYDFNARRSLFILNQMTEEDEGKRKMVRNKSKTPNIFEEDNWFKPRFVQIMLLLLSPGLILVDHIHFQYNGFLTGIFLLSVVRMMEDKVLQSSFFFAVLLHFKHIYIYAAPAFFVFILRNHCLDRHYNPRMKKFVSVASVVIGVTAVSLGPFINHLPQLLSRLFPFKRGLTHSYWAPNFWAIYNFIDWILFKTVALIFGSKTSHTPMYVKGLVQEFDHEVLPNITPGITFILTFLAMIPSLVQVWRCCHFPSPVSPKVVFLRSLTLSCLASFLFSWHVHEKAILMPLLPLTLLISVGNQMDCKIFLILSVTSTVSLFPLLPNSLLVTKVCILVLYLLYTVPALQLLVKFFHNRVSEETSLLTSLEALYLIGFVQLIIITCVLHPLLIPDKVPFLPLAITSVYCSFGVAYSFLELHRNLLRH